MLRLFVISDLHLGGRPDELHEGRMTRPGFQICNAYDQLRQFIDWLRVLGKESPEEQFELVINGDIVDFLAEDDFDDKAVETQIWTLDDTHAVKKFNKIVERTRDLSGRSVFDALRDFIAAGHRLTLLLGNHDVELSLPAVRQRLGEILAGGAGRLHVVYDGEAYRVGRVLIEHGNRYDRWNMIDHSALRQERSVRSRGLPISDDDRLARRYFVPPAGTHLVIQFMNGIKGRYRFVDLLKPETGAVIPLLAAMEPERGSKVDDILAAIPLVRKAVPLAKEFKLHQLRDATTPLHAGDLRFDQIEERLTLRQILEEELGETAALFFKNEAPALTDVYGDTGAGDLGLRDAGKKVINWFRARYQQLSELKSSASRLARIRYGAEVEDRYRQLHAGLKHLCGTDRSFDPLHEIATYLDAARGTIAGGDFDVVIYGHTHMPKRIELSAGSWYLNTGTWADVMRLPDAMAEDYEQALPELLNFIEALRQNDFSRYIKRYLSFVELVIDLEEGGRVEETHLWSFAGPGHERSAPLTNVASS
ncbi:MAG TPA: metallophosphoesterase [Pyrinomonadaceae bacterium]|jgi:UDP-2,3-diacylglucosamine pyrophosphatase LpxH